MSVLKKIKITIHKIQWVFNLQDYPAAVQSYSANSAGLWAPAYSFWDHRTPSLLKELSEKSSNEKNITLTTWQILPGREGGGKTHNLHGTLWLYKEAFLDPGWSLHTLLCAHTSFGTFAHPFIMCCCLMLCAFSKPQGWGENRNTRKPLLLANYNAVQSKSDSKLFRKPVQNCVLPLRKAQGSFSLIPGWR